MLHAGRPGGKGAALQQNSRQRCGGRLPPPGNAGLPWGAASRAVLGRGRRLRRLPGSGDALSGRFRVSFLKRPYEREGAEGGMFR